MRASPHFSHSMRPAPVQEAERAEAARRAMWGIGQARRRTLSASSTGPPGCLSAGIASAADLKFLHRLRQAHLRNFKSKSGTRIICLLVPLLLPKFVSGGAAMDHELRKRGTSVGRLNRMPRYGFLRPPPYLP